MIDRLTAQDLKHMAHTDDGSWTIHRHEGEHLDDQPCWCEPLVLTYDDIHGQSVQSLDDILAQFFAVH